MPGPGKYDDKNEWKDKILGSFKGGERNTYIDKIFKHGGEQVSPTAYKNIIPFEKQ